MKYRFVSIFALCMAALAAGAENRKTLNDRAAAHIASGTAPAAVRDMLGTSTGGARDGRHAGIAATAHVELLASHYGWWKTTRTYGGATVTSTNRVALSSWAAMHGFTATEIAEAGIGDVTISFVSGIIPDGCIPYFAPTGTLDARFGRAGGVAGWLSNQNQDTSLNVLPLTFTSDWHHWTDATDYQTAAPAAVRADIRAAAAGRTYHDVHSGDSGHPVVIDLGGNRLVLASFCTSAGHGPDLTHPTTIRILQAVAASVGDELKVWTGS